MNVFLDSTDQKENGPQLREHMARDGYLFIRGLLPTEPLEALRLRFLEIGRQGGWVKEGTPLAEAVADQDGFCVEPEPRYMEIYHRMYCIPEFHYLQHHPRLLEFFGHLLDGPVLPHPRLIGRIIFPQREAYTTPPHQDFIPIQGTAETYTAWFPLSTLTPDMGGLKVAAGSHRSGVYEFRPALGAGGLEITDDLSARWVGGSFEQGDVLIFHSMMVHSGVPSSGARLRLSVDARYQRADAPIAPGSLQPHSQPHTWEEIYAEWPDQRLQYYWRDLDLEMKEYDASYHQERDRQALELAAKGDVRTISTLQRIIARDADPKKRQQAAALLAAFDVDKV
jgi:hypothetical protein